MEELPYPYYPLKIMILQRIEFCIIKIIDIPTHRIRLVPLLLVLVPFLQMVPRQWLGTIIAPFNLWYNFGSHVGPIFKSTHLGVKILAPAGAVLGTIE